MIHRTGQLLVHVIEARNLRAADASGFSDPYVSLKVKAPKGRGNRSLRTTKYTYYISQNLNPKWDNQRFLFTLPATASKHPTAYSLHLQVFDYDMFSTPDFLGHVEVPLTTLQGEQETAGWFPLLDKSSILRKRGSSSKSSGGSGTTGSIRLCMQWVHEVPSLVKYRYALSADALRALKQRRRHHLSTEQSMAKKIRALTRGHGRGRGNRHRSRHGGGGSGGGSAGDHESEEGSGGGSGGGRHRRSSRSAGVGAGSGGGGSKGPATIDDSYHGALRRAGFKTKSEEDQQSSSTLNSTLDSHVSTCAGSKI